MLSLSLQEARWLALAAQGLGQARPGGTVDATAIFGAVDLAAALRRVA